MSAASPWDVLYRTTGVSVTGYHTDEHGVRHVRINNWEPYGRGNEKYVCLDLTYDQWKGLRDTIVNAADESALQSP